MLPEFIDNLIEQVNEDKLWQRYLAVALLEEKSFSEWKADILQGACRPDPIDSTFDMTESIFSPNPSASNTIFPTSVNKSICHPTKTVWREESIG